MPRPRPPRRNRLSSESEDLAQLSLSLAQSASRVEDGYWENRLAAKIDRLLQNGDDESLSATLDMLDKTDRRACDALADMIEACCESRCAATQAEHDVLMFAAPVLAWSRYSIASGTIAQEILANLRVQLGAHVFAADAQFGLADLLFSPDQLPASYSETAKLADKLTKAAVHGRDLHIDARTLPETISFLSDTRYLLGVVASKRDAPMFRWQESDGKRDESMARWRQQGGETLRTLLPASAIEPLLPTAFHAACREAERHSRPYSIRASVSFLSTAVGISPDKLCVVIAPFKDSHVEEYRLGFVDMTTNNVVHGVVWPLLDAEDGSETPALVAAVLRECAVGDVRIIEHSFPLEYCDDCGAPLYPNTEGEAVHAELPEDDGTQPMQHLH